MIARAVPLVVVALLLASSLAQASAVGVARCKDADAAFDYETAVQECALAAADTTISREEKVLVYRLLGIAHTALGDDARAETWFIRLLVLDAGHALPENASPVYLKAFAAAKKRFEKEGKVTVTQRATVDGDRTSAGGLKVSYTVTDALGRVQDARVRVRAFTDAASSAPVDVALVRAPGATPGSFVLDGEVPNPGPPAGVSGTYRVEYRLVLLSSVGDEVPADPALVPLAFEATAVAAAGESEGLSPTWIAVGAGGAAAVVVVVLVAGAGATAALVCFTTELCATDEGPARVIVGP